jgi:hypothetical protein
MLKKISKRLSYANVMASLAVFCVLGGGMAVAAGVQKNAVKSKSVKDNTLRSQDLKDGSAVDGADVVDNGIKGADVDESSLTLAAQSVRAYGSVDGRNCPPPPGSVCNVTRKKGITRVEAGAFDGSYCVTAPGLSPDSSPAFTTVDALIILDATLTSLSEPRNPSAYCPPGQFTILTYADFDGAPPALRGDLGFNVMIP